MDLSNLETYISIYAALPNNPPTNSETVEYLLTIGHSLNFIKRLYEGQNITLNIPDIKHIPPTEPSLTPLQVAILRCLLDPADQRPLHKILEDCECPTQFFQIFLDDPFFRQCYQLLLQSQIEKTKLLALTNILNRAAYGDFTAINTISNLQSSRQELTSGTNAVSNPNELGQTPSVPSISAESRNQEGNALP